MKRRIIKLFIHSAVWGVIAVILATLFNLDPVKEMALVMGGFIYIVTKN